MIFIPILTSFFLPLAHGQWDHNMFPGRHTLVHLFEWKWSNIAEECEVFLGPYGYGGVQISPPNENAVILDPYRPWYERYQPVSYKLNTRSGNESEFADMVSRCNAAGVRIYVDAVINHMSGAFLEGIGTGGSTFSGPRKDYPGVPYSVFDFNGYGFGPGDCPNPIGNISNYDDPNEVRNCELVFLRDLKLSTNYTRGMITAYLNKLIDYGVAGFSGCFKTHVARGFSLYLLSDGHGFLPFTKPFIFQEVIDLGGNEPISGDEYFDLGRVTEFKYGKELGEVFKKIDDKKLSYLINWGPGADGTGWGLYPSELALAFIDNHDNQRGHGAGGENILTFRNSRLYKMAMSFMLAHPYGITRVMSSYGWEPFEADYTGPPNHDGIIDDVPINEDLTCSGGWICEHRWRQIYNMVKFRNVVMGTGLNDWTDNGNNQITFCRGDKGFLAINNDDYPMNGTFQTCLASGTYCDVISGNLEKGACTGKSVVVQTFGFSEIYIANTEHDAFEDPIIALHVDAKL